MKASSRSRTCSLCSEELPRDPEKLFRVARHQSKGLAAEGVYLRKILRHDNLCGACATDCRKAGLRMVTVAQIRAWGQMKTARALLERLGQADAKALQELKAKLEAEAVAES